ncbi:MAG: hypothetical protein AVDCRST_MAG50-1981 [uncultured Acidimicrobiales bacterium]|uniref:Methyltransferase domain-containing protein n=1 Tax=uncultured Acidimicrobiales bacterium TaxID=310071 RepID=A0A6J4IBQ8_9ACTN|nr:MAG: hypothetical protein AVDCRST_MAG50-1981 [uncultured Acidimicrobiales bacterium]
MTPADTWAEAAAFMGEAYLRYSFTKGTEQEVEFLIDALGLRPGMRALDVGCGPGRHALALAQRDIEVVGIDIAERFIELARRGAPARATFDVGDARALPYHAEFDAVISLCQGGFGLVGEHDPSVLDGMARALKPGGLLALSAFSAYFAVRYLEETDEFDADKGENTEEATLRNATGDEIPFPLRTTCFTPRELRLLCARSGLGVESLWSVAPGRYRRERPGLESPEFLLIARKP